MPLSYTKLIALSSYLLVSMGGRRSQCLGPSPTLGSLGPSHQWRHKSRMLLQGSPCVHDVSGTPNREVCDKIGLQFGHVEHIFDMYSVDFTYHDFFHDNGPHSIVLITLSSSKCPLCAECCLCKVMCLVTLESIIYFHPLLDCTLLHITNA